MIRLSLESYISSEIHYLANLLYSVSESSLSVVLIVKNLACQPFPFNIGLHPFFSANEKSKLCLLHEGYWPEGVNHLPMAYEEKVPDKHDFRSEKFFSGEWVNHCYKAPSSLITLSQPELGYKIEIDYSTDYVTLYQPSSSDGFICIEPQSYPTDAYNMMNVPAIGSGQSLSVKLTIRVIFD